MLAAFGWLASLPFATFLLSWLCLFKIAVLPSILRVLKIMLGQLLTYPLLVVDGWWVGVEGKSRNK